jgi:hypothetical protein
LASAAAIWSNAPVTTVGRTAPHQWPAAPDGPADLAAGGAGIVEVHAGNAVHLQVDPPRRQVHAIGRRFRQIANREDGLVEDGLDGAPRDRVETRTFFGHAALFTVLPHRFPRKPLKALRNKSVEMAAKAASSGGVFPAGLVKKT